MLELYTEFVNLRQQVFYKKLENPGYIDPTLGTNKFTNVYRVLDRVSQYELKEVVYSGSQEPLEILHRIFLFNQFKTQSFWELWKQSDGDLNNLPDIISSYQGTPKLYTNAYVVPGKSGEPKAKTIMSRCLRLRQFNNSLEGAIRNKDIVSIFAIMRQIDGIGSFLSSQVCFDFLWHESTDGWVPLYELGVGAIRGAKKLGLTNSYKRAIETAKESLIGFPYLTVQGKEVPLSSADIQNTFCEMDKYLRIVRPDITLSNSSPKKIKNVYKPGNTIGYKIPGFLIGLSGLVDIDK